MNAIFSTLAVSPLADVLGNANFVRGEQAANLAIADLSSHARFGCKGPGASAWLSALNVPIPAAPNSAVVFGASRVLRLGITEFLVEADAAVIETLSSTPRGAGVYPVLRQDACLLLSGRKLNELLLQSCNVNFAALDLSTNPVVLTSMVGVSVSVLPESKNGVLCYRVWCDSSYGAYLWQTLRTIAEELGGGATDASLVASLI